MQEENILIQAGLSEEQAQVYQSLIDRGPMKASDLSKWSGIKRGLIYKVLEQLESMGLVSKTDGAGTVAVFSPAHPSILLSNIERKEKEIALTKEMLSSSLGSLSSKFNMITGKPNVQFYEGEEGIRKVIFDNLSSKTEILAYLDMSIIDQYIPEINKEYVAQRNKKQLKKRNLVSDTIENRSRLGNYHRDITEVRLMKIEEQATKFGSLIQIYDDKISYITLNPDRMIGVIIEDKDIVEMHRQLYLYTWKFAEPLGEESN